MVVRLNWRVLDMSFSAYICFCPYFGGLCTSLTLILHFKPFGNEFDCVKWSERPKSKFDCILSVAQSASGVDWEIPTSLSAICGPRVSVGLPRLVLLYSFAEDRGRFETSKVLFGVESGQKLTQNFAFWTRRVGTAVDVYFSSESEAVKGRSFSEAAEDLPVVTSDICTRGVHA